MLGRRGLSGRKVIFAHCGPRAVHRFVLVISQDPKSRLLTVSIAFREFHPRGAFIRGSRPSAATRKSHELIGPACRAEKCALQSSDGWRDAPRSTDRRTVVRTPARTAGDLAAAHPPRRLPARSLRSMCLRKASGRDAKGTLLAALLSDEGARRRGPRVYQPPVALPSTLVRFLARAGVRKRPAGRRTLTRTLSLFGSQLLGMGRTVLLTISSHCPRSAEGRIRQLPVFW